MSHLLQLSLPLCSTLDSRMIYDLRMGNRERLEPRDDVGITDGHSGRIWDPIEAQGRGVE